MEGIILQAKTDLRHVISFHLPDVQVVIGVEAVDLDVEKTMGVQAVKFHIGHVVDANHEVGTVKGISLLGLQSLDGRFPNIPLNVAPSGFYC